jgi:hypothetical protein
VVQSTLVARNVHIFFHCIKFLRSRVSECRTFCFERLPRKRLDQTGRNDALVDGDSTILALEPTRTRKVLGVTVTSNPRIMSMTEI